MRLEHAGFEVDIQLNGYAGLHAIVEELTPSFSEANRRGKVHKQLTVLIAVPMRHRKTGRFGVDQTAKAA